MFTINISNAADQPQCKTLKKYQ